MGIAKACCGSLPQHAFDCPKRALPFWGSLAGNPPAGAGGFPVIGRKRMGLFHPSAPQHRGRRQGSRRRQQQGGVAGLHRLGAVTCTASRLTALSLPARSTALAYTGVAVGAKGPVYSTHSVPS